MAPPDLARIGKYQITDLIGEGAMGVVYRAMDPVLARSVAIKVMTEAPARDPELRDRFLREAQTAGSLQHPNIIVIYDCGEVDGHLYIAMEYLEGVDLATILDRREPLALENKLDIAIDVLAGLEYAHEHGVVHRDIKPANIRITKHGRAKIMDFGIAHLGTSNLTRTGMMLGTPNYMAPEQVTGERTSPATDIFAFGAVLFELLTGTKPFAGPTLHNIFYRIVSEDAPSLQKCLPGLPAALDHTVRRALAKEPKDRFASALEMANELSAVRAALSGDPREATLSLRATVASTLASQKKRSRAKRRWAMWTAAVAVPALVVGGAWLVGVDGRGRAPSASQVLRSDSAGGAVVSAPTSAAASASAPSGASRAPPAPARETVRVLIPEPRAQAPAAAPHRSEQAPAERRRVAAREGDRPSTREPETVHAAAQPADSAATRAAKPPIIASNAPVGIAPSSLGITPSSTAAPAPSTTAPRPPAAAPPVAVMPPAPPVANASAEISGVIDRYARAIGSRDVSQVRRAYPGLTATQQRGFEDFFRSVRSLRAGLTVSDLVVSGVTAEGQVTGAYEFVDGNGRSQRQPITFHAAFGKTDRGWELVGVR
ncbi:MAG TPA: serine/threonine-protein kinase [Gemmatimonadaceae bacterium]